MKKILLLLILSFCYTSAVNACVQPVDPKEMYSEHTKRALKKLLPLAE